MYRGYSGYRQAYSLPKSYQTLQKYPQDIQCVFPSDNPSKGSIYVSNVQAAQNFQTLSRFNIKAVMTCAKGYDRNIPKNRLDMFQYFPLQDKQSCLILPYIEKACNFIAEALQHTNILVHCIAGVSRSVSLVIAYLIRDKGMSYQSAYNTIKSRRKIISPNQGFIHQLKQYAKSLKDSMNVTVGIRSSQGTNQGSMLQQSRYSKGLVESRYTEYVPNNNGSIYRNKSINLSLSNPGTNASPSPSPSPSPHHNATPSPHQKPLTSPSPPKNDQKLYHTTIKRTQTSYSNTQPHRKPDIHNQQDRPTPAYNNNQPQNQHQLKRTNTDYVQLSVNIGNVASNKNNFEQNNSDVIYRNSSSSRVYENNKLMENKSVTFIESGTNQSRVKTPQKLLSNTSAHNYNYSYPSSSSPYSNNTRQHLNKTVEKISSKYEPYTIKKNSNSNPIDANGNYQQRSVYFKQMNEDLNTKIQAIHDKYQKQREVLLAKRLGYSQSSDKQQLDNGRAYGQVGNSIGKDQNIVNNNSTNIHKYRYEIYNNNKIQNQSNIGASINYTRNSIYDKYTTRNTTHTATTSTPIDTYTKYDKFGGYVKDSKKYADLYENKYARGLHYNDLKNNRTFYGGVSTNRYY